MSKIGEIDKNLNVENTVGKDDLIWINAKSDVFNIYGLYEPKNNDVFRRMPEEVAENTNPGVVHLHTNTSGGRITFETDSQYVAIKMTSKANTRFSHMPFTGVAGFDLYIYDEHKFTYWKTFTPPFAFDDGYESVVNFPTPGTRKVMLHFPLYNNVDTLHIGLQKDSEVKSFAPYKDVPPILYYGSSITQGGCASRPGNNYPAIISRWNMIDFICLGFSGSAHGEFAFAAYIASLDLSIFVMDYDHNDNAENLRIHHEPFFKRYREQKPNTPVIFVTAPDFDNDKAAFTERRSIIRQTYENAVAAGDKNVYFVDGEKLFMGDLRDSCTVDGCHPNDLGFARMAEVIYKAIGLVR